MNPTRTQPSIEPLEARIAPATFTVTSAADSGPGTLHQAILDANATEGADTITFELPPDATSLRLVNPLPSITDRVTLDGATQPGYLGAWPKVAIDGSNAGPSPFGLLFEEGSHGSSVKALEILGFAGTGIGIAANSVAVTGCVVGSLEGLAAGNRVGIDVRPGSRNVQIGGSISPDSLLLEGGGSLFGNMNIISGNHEDGIRVSGGFDTKIIGNRIGGLDGTGNGRSGINLIAGDHTIIGEAEFGANVIGGNGANGLAIESKATNTIIQGNRIGVSYSGISALPNGSNGISASGVTTLQIGGTKANEGNIISASGGYGIALRTAPQLPVFITSIKVEGNVIGTAIAGAAALGNAGGIVIEGLPGVRIGGPAAGAGNVISGNGTSTQTTYGVLIQSATFCIVDGNFIGTDRTGLMDLGNRLDGIGIVGGESHVIRDNVISGNGRHGINVGVAGAPSTTGHHIQGNIIGANLGGTAALPNDGSGIFFTSAARNVLIGGSSEGMVRNIISGNLASGIVVDGNTHRIEGNYVGLSSDGITPIGNKQNGILIASNSSLNVVVENVVSANGTAGTAYAAISVNGRSNSLIGNMIGFDATGQLVLGNSSHGILATNASGLLIDDNLIGGSQGDGIRLAGSASQIEIRANRIGCGMETQRMAPNQTSGINIGGSVFSVTIGGPERADGNIIVWNGLNGIDANGEVFIGNNLIGTDGETAMPNQVHGIIVGSGGFDRTATIFQNVISGNFGDGINGSGKGNSIYITDNFIGTNSVGDSAIPNSGDGIDISNQSVTGNNSVGYNVVSGNLGDGVRVTGGATLTENRIGTSADGTKVIGNARHGVEVMSSALPVLIAAKRSVAIAGNGLDGIHVASGAHVNIYGMLVTGNGNDGIDVTDPKWLTIRDCVVSGNVRDGIHITNNGEPEQFEITGNIVGLDPTGKKPMGNGGHGLYLNSPGSIVIDGEPNIFAANAGDGIHLTAAPVNLHHPHIIRGQTIGTQIFGQYIGNGGNGISIVGPLDVVLEDNDIIWSGDSGVYATDGLFGASIELRDNFISMRRLWNSPPTRGDGVQILGTVDLLATGNVIVGYSGAGILMLGGMAELSRNLIYAGNGLPVDLGGDGPTPNDPGDLDYGPSGLQNSLVIPYVVATNDRTILRGEFDGTRYQTFRVEIFTIRQGKLEFLTETTIPRYETQLTLTLPLLPVGTELQVSVTDTSSGTTSEYTTATVAAAPKYLVASTGPGVRTKINVFDTTDPTTPKFTIFPFDGKGQGGARVATGDLNGDGFPEIIATPLTGKNLLWIYDGLSGSLATVQKGVPYDYFGPLSVTAADTDGDGRAEIITAPRRGGANYIYVKMFNGTFTDILTSLKATGLDVAAGDLDGDGRAEIVASTLSGRPLAKVFSADGNQSTDAFQVIGRSIDILDAAPGGEGRIVVGSGQGRSSLIDILTPDGVLETRHKVAKIIAGNSALQIAVTDKGSYGYDRIFVARSHSGVPEVFGFTTFGSYFGRDLLFGRGMSAGIRIAT